MKKLFKEPLLHFILLGFIFFGLYNVVNKQSDSDSVILIDDFDMKNIIASWEMQWQRLPTDEELKSLIWQNIKQEIFYQEALKMNLDHNDEIIKRRLAQKMQFLSNDLATMSEPTEEDLKEYYKEHAQKYLLPYSYSLYQIIFSPDKRNDPKSDANDLLGKIRNVDPDQISNRGDAMPFPFYFKQTDADELKRQLGNKFSDALENLPLEQWAGPVVSGFGYHLVYITDRKKPQIPDFESLKDELKRDFEYDKQQKMDQMIFEELKKQYQIEYDLDAEKFDESFIEYLQEE